MVGRTANGLRTVTAYTGVPRDQLIRIHPSLDGISRHRQEEAQALAADYMTFIDKNRIASEVVQSVIDMAKERGYKRLSDQTVRSRNMYYTTEEGTAFALIKLGEAPITQGVRVLYAHTDSPCLQTKPNPIVIQWDPDKKDHQIGVALNIIGYGGVNPHQWTGHDLELRGWSVREGRKSFVKVPLYSSDLCAHTDKRQVEKTEYSDAHKLDSIKVDTGDNTIPKLLKRLKLKSLEDFSRASFFAVPTNRPRKMSSYYISGYGHDNRACVFTTTRALFDTNTKYTSIVLGFDKEEVGSYGPGSGEGGLFERVYDEVLLRTWKKDRPRDPLEFRVAERRLKDNSIAVNTDVDVGSNALELENGADLWNVAKMGFGLFLLASTGKYSRDQISPILVDKIYSILGGEITHQAIGEPLPSDEGAIESVNYLLDKRGFQTVTLGPPVASLHSPSELVHIGDLAASCWAYRKMLEAPVQKVRRQ